MGFGQCELTTRLTYSNFSTHKHIWRSSISLHTQTFAQHVCQPKRCTHACKQQSKTYGTHSMCLLQHCIQTNQISCVASHISIAHSHLQPSKPVNTAQAHTLTTHFNIILGNIPKHFRQAETINSIFRHTWTNCRQSEDVHTQTIIGSSKGLNFYVLKEAHYDKQKIVGDISTWDIDNTFIPNAAVYAD